MAAIFTSTAWPMSTVFAVSSDGSWRMHGTPPLSSHLRPARSVCADFGQQNLRGQLWTAGIGIFSDFFTGQSVWKYFCGLKEEEIFFLCGKMGLYRRNRMRIAASQKSA